VQGVARQLRHSAHTSRKRPSLDLADGERHPIRPLQVKGNAFAGTLKLGQRSGWSQPSSAVLVIALRGSQEPSTINNAQTPGLLVPHSTYGQTGRQTDGRSPTRHSSCLPSGASICAQPHWIWAQADGQTDGRTDSLLCVCVCVRVCAWVLPPVPQLNFMALHASTGVVEAV
jgi:hypothetical protein